MDIDLLSKMVKELILDKDEVSLPGVGTFVAEMVPSVFSDKGYTINPPYKRLSFRQKGTGDNSLLIDFYAKCNNLDIETASRIIREFLHEMRHVLETRKSIVFPGLGKLRATRENYFFFVADEDLDIYPEGFGLEPISLKTHEETPAEVSATMAALRGILNPEETAAGEVNVTPDSVHDFLPSEANVAVKVNIPVREVPVSESAVASSMETEVPSEESSEVPVADVAVAAESSDTENVDAGVHTAGTSDVESSSGVSAGMWSGTNSVSGAETSGTESVSDVNAGLESGPDSAAEAVASDDNEAASSAAKTGDANGSQVEATEVPASGSQVNASAESNAAPSDIIDNESGAEASEEADNYIDSVSDREGADAAVQQGEDVAAGQKADAVTTVVSGECPDAAVDVVDGQSHAAESPVAGQKVEESAGAEGAATSAKVGESAGTEGAATVAKVGESAGAEDDAMAAKVEESAGAVVAGEGAAESGSDMPAAGQGNADNGSSASASPVAKPASDKSGKVIKTMPGRFSKKKPNWRKVLKWSCIGAVLLALTMLLAFIALAHIAPDFIDSILYSPDELRIINY